MLPYLALGCVVLALYLLATGGKPVFKRREWRFLSGAAAIVAFSGGAAMAVMNKWGAAIVLIVVGLWLASATRARGMAAPPGSRMSVAEARRILGVEEGASREEIQAAYTRLMRLAHPDKGGTAGLAAQLNAARDRLLSK